MSTLTSPFGATLSPLSMSFAISSVGGVNEAVTFISGSGITISGSAPGCQLSMLSTLPPSEELPKNRFDVLTRNGSRGGAAGMVARFSASSGWSASERAASLARGVLVYCGSGGARSASASSGSSAAADSGDIACGSATVLAPNTELFEVAGSSCAGAAVGALASGACVGVIIARRSPFMERSTLGKSEAW
ncbi:hypothetical protein ACVWWR_005226 [Bradyrhizobium sp. LM3.2]